MAQNIHFYLLITIMIYLSQTLAQWIGQTLYVPGPGTTHNCENWIVKSGFDRTNPRENIGRAQNRNKKYDEDVSIWAVLFAHYCTVFPVRVDNVRYLPVNYCTNQGYGFRNNRNNVLLPFENYSNFEATCEGWLKLYNFSNYDQKNNFVSAKARVPTEDGVISLWVAVYCQLITEFKISESLSINKYCSIMVKNDKQMLFMSLDGTRKPCSEWIHLSGYTDTHSTNLEKARNEKEQIKKYRQFINFWTVWYVAYLLRSEDHSFGILFSFSEYPNDHHMTPLEFCIHEEYLDNNPVSYDNRP